jgi:hypothetical protein
MSNVGAFCVVSPHGVPLLIRCVGSAAPPQREVVGILNAVYQSVKQQLIGEDSDPLAEYVHGSAATAAAI